jgi:small ligand-binding sensory domain FIST
MTAFAYAHAAGAGWQECVRACAPALGKPGAGLGFVYFTDPLAEDAQRIVEELKALTGVQDWVGTVGTGIMATGTEYQDQGALAVMLLPIEPHQYQVFSGKRPLRRSMSYAVVHADPQAPDVPGLVADMSAKLASGFAIGGISSSRSGTVQVANEVLSGGLSGVGFAGEIGMSVRLTQACVPYPGRFRVTEGEDNIVAMLDGRPALEVLQEAVQGERAQILVGIPVPGSDRGDYTARNLLGADSRSGAIAIGDVVEPGMELVFLKRDAAAARQDLERMLLELKLAAPSPRGALYFSCVARGEHMFGRRGAELSLVREALGEVPLVGFFCNGEISRDRLYGYTGVLAVFH